MSEWTVVHSIQDFTHLYVKKMYLIQCTKQSWRQIGEKQLYLNEGFIYQSEENLKCVLYNIKFVVLQMKVLLNFNNLIILMFTFLKHNIYCIINHSVLTFLRCG